MAQGYPQGSYGQDPYGQAPAQAPYGQAPYGQAPYGQPANPYGQPPGPYGQAPDPYAQPASPYAGHPAPYQQQPPQQQYAQQSPYAAQQPWPAPAPTPRAPEEAGDFRRGTGAILDTVLATAAGFTAANAADHHAWPGGYGGALFGVAIAFSFINQVVLGRLFGCSLGKFVTATRVIRYKDVSRPLTGRLTRRWLLGFVMVLTLVFDEFPESEEACGVRTVRWKHLQAVQLG